MAEINHYLSDEEAFKLDTVSVRLVKGSEPVTSEEPLTSPEAVVRALADEMSWYDREVVGVINFDNKMRPVNVNFVSMGALDQSIAHPREILKSAILSNAASMMMIHNHPSQDVTPSRADVEITDRMMRLCELAGIPLIDHIIVGGQGKEYFSFAEKKAMPVIKLNYQNNYNRLDFAHVADENNINMFSSNIEGLSDALNETNRMLSGISGENVTESVTGVSKEINGYKKEKYTDVTDAVENREHTHYGAYADIGKVLDRFTTDELIRHLRENESGGEHLIRNYVESQITEAQIDRERYRDEYENRMYYATNVSEEMTDVKADIETEETESEYEEISSPRL